MNHPSFVFVNANVICMDKKLNRFEALAVEDDRVVAAGENEEILELTGDCTEIIDLQNKTVVPGFIDTHVHFVSTGQRLSNMIDLTQANNIEELLNLVRRETRTRSNSEPVLGWGFDHTALAENRYPTREELDKAAPNHPVVLKRRDGHSTILNSKAVDEVGIEPDAPGVQTDDSGQPTGIFQAQANSRVREWMDSTLENLKLGKEACRAAASEAIEVGITTIHALTGGKPEDFEGQAMAAVQEELPVHLVKYFQTTDVDSVLNADLSRIGGCILLDGSMGSQTAALGETYSDNPDTRGVLYYSQDEIDGFVMKAHNEGLQIALHAIGERAIDQALNAYEKALTKKYRSDHRHRIEHFLVPTDEQIERAKELGIALAMQPAFEYFWGGPGKLYEQRLGERVKRTNPFRWLMDNDLLVGGGSDSLVTPMNPLLGIHSAVNHPTKKYRLNREQALRIFTIDAAKLAFEEANKGSITPGKLADMVVLDDDPTRVPAQDIKNINVLATVTSGNIIYGREMLG